MAGALSLLIEPLHVLCYYLMFFAQNHQLLKGREKRRNYVNLTIAVFVMLVAQVIIELFARQTILYFLCTNVVTLILLLIITYFPLRQGNERDMLLKINLFLGMSGFITVQLITAYLDRYLTVAFAHATVLSPMLWVIIVHKIIEAILGIIVGIVFAKLYSTEKINTQHLNETVLTLVVILFIFTWGLLCYFTFGQTLYEHIDIFLIFVIVQLTVFWILYFVINKREKERIQNEMIAERLDNLKNYTNHLEQEQRKLRKFKHDYQNMMLSLEETLRKEDSKEIHEYIDTFKKYSDQYISENSLWMFNDFENIKAPYLKSVLINKTSQAVDMGIDVHFECKYEVKEVDMQPYDLVRIIAIACDNAIEEVKNLDKEHKKINVMLYQSDDQLEINILNPIAEKKDIQKIKQEGVTSKKGHSGFGLANIEEISGEYSNLLVNYTEQNNWFKVQFIILEETDLQKLGL